jgi:uncharacterized protein (DUF885 family)
VADPAADEEFRALVDRLADRSRSTRAFLLRRYDASRLTPRGRILYDAILPGIEADAALSRMNWGSAGYPYPVTHRSGSWRRASEMRADDTPRYWMREVERDTNRMYGHASRGVIAPGFALDAADRSLVQAIARVAPRAEGDGREIHEALVRQLQAVRELRPRAGSEPGMWRLPNGEEYYATVLQFQLGAPVDPREAHARALDRCRALQNEADALLRARGLTQGDVAERLRTLARDPRYLYGQDDAGKARAVADMAASLTRARTVLRDVLVDTMEAPAEVRRLPAAQEANGTQGRRQGAAYLVDLGAPRASWTLPSVVHHELVPGHIYQEPFAGAADIATLQERYANGYLEGWSSYAEQLADESGAFEGDPLGRIGYLQWMLFRTARIVCDTGIHAMRWSRERAIEEMRALQGESIAFVTIEEDVLRFCVQPGVYTAQGFAMLHIGDLRERMRRNPRFDMKRFHTAMLQHGPLSPPGLEQAARAAFP